MDIPVKTLSNGFSLPVYGLGTWAMGGGMQADYSEDERYITAIRDAIEHGISHIDTAEMYGNGHSEELVGQATQGIDRNKLQLVSKVSVGMDGGHDGVLRACEASLKRLGTDYLDVYLLHYVPPANSVDIMKAMDRLIDEGVVRNIGVCNMTTNRFQALQDMTANKLVCHQLEYSLQCREVVDKGVLEFCQSNDVLVTAWGPLSKGMLSENVSVLREIAEKYGKTPYQIALNWLLAQQNVITIPKTTSVEHLEENLGALGWELAAEDVQRLTDEYPNQQLVSERRPLVETGELEP